MNRFSGSLPDPHLHSHPPPPPDRRMGTKPIFFVVFLTVGNSFSSFAINNYHCPRPRAREISSFSRSTPRTSHHPPPAQPLPQSLPLPRSPPPSGPPPPAQPPSPSLDRPPPPPQVLCPTPSLDLPPARSGPPPPAQVSSPPPPPPLQPGSPRTRARPARGGAPSRPPERRQRMGGNLLSTGVQFRAALSAEPHNWNNYPDIYFTLPAANPQVPNPPRRPRSHARASRWQRSAGPGRAPRPRLRAGRPAKHVPATPASPAPRRGTGDRAPPAPGAATPGPGARPAREGVPEGGRASPGRGGPRPAAYLGGLADLEQVQPVGVPVLDDVGQLPPLLVAAARRHPPAALARPPGPPRGRGRVGVGRGATRLGLRARLGARPRRPAPRAPGSRLRAPGSALPDPRPRPAASALELSGSAGSSTASTGPAPRHSRLPAPRQPAGRCVPRAPARTRRRPARRARPRARAPAPAPPASARWCCARLRAAPPAGRGWVPTVGTGSDWWARFGPYRVRADGTGSDGQAAGFGRYRVQTGGTRSDRWAGFGWAVLVRLGGQVRTVGSDGRAGFVWYRVGTGGIGSS